MIDQRTKDGKTITRTSHSSADHTLPELSKSSDAPAA
jgi:hypothetical protein